jgi:serine/threonine protein kinase
MMLPAATQPDTFVARYRPLLELGRGGMARVYLAESLASGLLRKLVVLKVLNQDLAANPDMREAFIREAELNARLNHPNIVNVYEVFEQGNTPVMVMQHLDGMALSEVTSRLEGKVPFKLHLHILCQVLGALHYFHELKGPSGESLECVHRDVSPHNVMVLHEGGIKVVDFGIAKVRAEAESHTRTGVIKGKVAYMAPEQLLACANVDRRADLYSVGVMLWEAVAGRRMWRGMEPSARMRAIARGELPDIREAAPGVSDALAKIIGRALSHTPDARHATAEEMQIELEQIAHTEGGYSLPRELSEFMRLNFGDDRREKQRKLEKAVEDPEYSVADASWSVTRRPSLGFEASSVQAASTGPSPPYVAPRRLRKLVAAAVVAVASGVALATFSESSNTSSKAAPDSASAGPVTLRVRSNPEGAEVYLDGVKLGVTPLLQRRAPSAQDATLELRAPGRVTRSKTIRFQEDVALDLTLPQDAAREPSREGKVTSGQGAGEAPAEAESNANAREHDHAQTSARQRRLAAHVSGASQAKPASEAKPASDTPTAADAQKPSAARESCDPPYSLDPGGVKVFKPQCF